MITAGQLASPTLLGAYWVESVGHGIIADGTRFLVVRPWHGDWLLCWRDGVRPVHSGTLLKQGQVERV